MKKTSGFFFSLLLLFLAVPVAAQDSIKYDIGFMHGFRVGVDVSRMLLPLLYDDNRMGLEFSVDKQISTNGFVTAELGILRADSRRTEYHYKTEGRYIRLGYDRNIIRFREPNLRDVVYVGLRYGLSRFSHSMDDMMVPPGYWEGAPAGSMKKDGLTAHWMEAVVGTKVELMRNFYLGMAMRGKIKLSVPKDEYFTPLLIPGYGKGDKGVALSWSYSLFYTFDPAGKNK